MPELPTTLLLQAMPFIFTIGAHAPCDRANNVVGTAENEVVVVWKTEWSTTKGLHNGEASAVLLNFDDASMAAKVAAALTDDTMDSADQDIKDSFAAECASPKMATKSQIDKVTSHWRTLGKTVTIADGVHLGYVVPSIVVPLIEHNIYKKSVPVKDAVVTMLDATKCSLEYVFETKQYSCQLLLESLKEALDAVSSHGGGGGAPVAVVVSLSTIFVDQNMIDLVKRLPISAAITEAGKVSGNELSDLASAAGILTSVNLLNPTASETDRALAANSTADKLQKMRDAGREPAAGWPTTTPQALGLAFKSSVPSKSNTPLCDALFELLKSNAAIFIPPAEFLKKSVLLTTFPDSRESVRDMPSIAMLKLEKFLEHTTSMSTAAEIAASGAKGTDEIFQHLALNYSGPSCDQRPATPVQPPHVPSGPAPLPPHASEWSSRSHRVMLNTLTTANTDVDSATVNRAALDATAVGNSSAMTAKLLSMSGHIDGNAQLLASEATKLSSMAALDRIIKVPLGEDFVSTMINAGVPRFPSRNISTRTRIHACAHIAIARGRGVAAAMLILAWLRPCLSRLEPISGETYQ